MANAKRVGRERKEGTRSLLSFLKPHLPYTVITGERRSSPIRTESDILLYPGWIDFALLTRLPGISEAILAPDTVFAEDWMSGRYDRRAFDNVIVSVGAPDVNFASFVANGLALFRFHTDSQARNEMLDFFEHLGPINDESRYRRLLLKEAPRLAALRKRLCPSAFFDPLKADATGQAGDCVWLEEVSRFDHGVVSLAEHPLNNGSFCIIAGGIRGVGTAGALRLLAGATIWDPFCNCEAGLESRPLGGVFRRYRYSNRQRPHDILNIESDLEWVTPPYTSDKLLARLRSLAKTRPVSGNMTVHDLKRDIALIGRFVSGRAVERGDSRYRVGILVGGRGERMRDYTKGRISKPELPVPFRRGNTARPQKETVVGILVWALKQTGLVDQIVLISSGKRLETGKTYLNRHQELARRLSREYGLPVEAHSDKGSTDLEVLSDLVGQAAAAEQKTVLMMGDTLFPPEHLKSLLTWFSANRLHAGLGCSRVAAHSTSRYGVVKTDHEGRIRRIWEKPGNGAATLVSQGFYIFDSLSDNWIQRIRQSSATNVVGFLDYLCQDDAVPLHAFILGGPLYDCGSKEGYEKALDDGKKGKIWKKE